METASVHDVAIAGIAACIPKHLLPATAPLLQERLDLPRTCLALNINLVCSGYTYGRQVVSSFLSAGGLKNVVHAK